MPAQVAVNEEVDPVLAVQRLTLENAALKSELRCAASGVIMHFLLAVRKSECSGSGIHTAAWSSDSRQRPHKEPDDFLSSIRITC